MTDSKGTVPDFCNVSPDFNIGSEIHLAQKIKLNSDKYQMPHIRAEVKVRGEKPENWVSSYLEPDRKDCVIYVPEAVNISKARTYVYTEHFGFPSS